MKNSQSLDHYAERVYITSRKRIMANILIKAYWPEIKKKLEDNPGSTVRLRLSQIRKLLKNGYFDPDIPEKTAREALAILTEEKIQPEGYSCRYNSQESETFFEIYKAEEEETTK